jgi:hypothetical protein
LELISVAESSQAFKVSGHCQPDGHFANITYTWGKDDHFSFVVSFEKVYIHPSIFDANSSPGIIHFNEFCLLGKSWEKRRVAYQALLSHI